MELVRVNVSGNSFLLSTQISSERGLLKTFLDSPHSDRLRIADAYLADTNEYFFARSPSLFEPILHFHLTGELHKPKEVCLEKFKGELVFWQLEQKLVAQCCRQGFEQEELKTNETSKELEPRRLKFKDRIWNFCEGDGSLASTGFQTISFAFIIVSIVCLILGTMDSFRVPREGSEGGSKNMSGGLSKSNTKPHPIFDLIEYVCIAFFTAEYLIRLLLAPRKIAFVKDPMSIVDVTAILPFYIETLIQIVGVDTSGVLSATVVLRVLRVLRVARILRLGRHSSLTRKFGIALKSAAKRLVACLLFLVIMIIFFSTFVYYMEEGSEESPITSIPMGFWYCIVTMTTVGYGDVVPVTILGKMVGSVAILAGVIVLALPITIIVSNFSNNEIMVGDL